MTSESSFRMNTCWKPLLLLLLAFIGTEACADIYSYEDAGGTMVFTDDPAKIPLKRGKVRRIPDGAGMAQPITKEHKGVKSPKIKFEIWRLDPLGMCGKDIFAGIFGVAVRQRDI